MSNAVWNIRYVIEMSFLFVRSCSWLKLVAGSPLFFTSNLCPTQFLSAYYTSLLTQISSSTPYHHFACSHNASLHDSLKNIVVGSRKTAAWNILWNSSLYLEVCKYVHEYNILLPTTFCAVKCPKTRSISSGWLAHTKKSQPDAHA
jgi:hypothetical protein